MFTMPLDPAAVSRFDPARSLSVQYQASGSTPGLIPAGVPIRGMTAIFNIYGTLVLDEPDLKVPHPELTRRSFVLVPLIEVDPLLVHPVTGEPMLAHLSRLKSRPPVKKGSRLWN